MNKRFLETKQKALEINLDPKVYGSFAEIGAGQEVARYFFQAGAAAGTVAKTISAYDKVVSDRIYGPEVSRYVCESRLVKMLDHEYDLMQDRLEDERPDTCFFAFADTVSAINYHKTNKGHGWMGLRFQTTPHEAYNDVLLHVKMHDPNTLQQQQAIGILGVNLVHGCFRYHEDYRLLIDSLIDGLSGRIEIDMIRLHGPAFNDFDNRLAALELVKQGLTRVTLFDTEGGPLHASEFLYKKCPLVIRGNFRPATLVSEDMIKTAAQQFKSEQDVEPRRTVVLIELTLGALRNREGEIDSADFLDRVHLINTMGYRVMISDCEKYKHLIRYMADYRPQRLGLVMDSLRLLDILRDKYYRNKDGRLLTSYGEVFTRNVTFFIYPTLKEGDEELLRSGNLPIPQAIESLYQYILDNRHVIDIEQFSPHILHIQSRDVLRMLRVDEEGWESMVSPEVAAYVKERAAFGFPCQQMNFEY